MSVSPPDRLRTVAFGAVDGTIWGAALSAGSAGALIIRGASGEPAGLALPAGGWKAEEATWHLSADGVQLAIEAVTEERESFPHPDGGDPIRGVQELCRVRGTVTASGGEHRLDCPGTRTVIDGVDPGGLDSVRAVAGWFGSDAAFTLLALRAPRSRGQESDLVAATLFDPEGWVPVDDPRLSTTYDGAGVPSRVNLELWVSEGENEFPRRAAGEATAPGAAVSAEGLQVRAVPLRCHSQGRDGGGVYLVAAR